MDAPLTVYKSTWVEGYLESKQNLVVIEIFTNKKKTLETYQYENTQIWKDLIKITTRKESTGIVHQQVFSRNTTDLGYWDKTKHQIKLIKAAQPFRRNYCSMSFDTRKAMIKMSKI